MWLIFDIQLDYINFIGRKVTKLSNIGVNSDGLSNILKVIILIALDGPDNKRTDLILHQTFLKILLILKKA